MEKAQAKGEVAEAELRALEMDVTGKVSSLTHTQSYNIYGASFFGCLDYARFLAWCKTGSYSGPPRGTSIDHIALYHFFIFVL